ncbi:hypothetical protein RDJ00_09475 [Bacillus subtilis]|nr:hypothetical protein [Bacillus subtilis]
MAEKSGCFVREESIDMCIEDLTALKIKLTSLGISPLEIGRTLSFEVFGIKMIRICSYHW